MAYKQAPHKGTGRSKFPFQLQCSLVKIESRTRLWGPVLTAFTDKGRFKIGGECHDLVNDLQIGEEYWFQYFTYNGNNTVVDVLNKI